MSSIEFLRSTPETTDAVHAGFTTTTANWLMFTFTQPWPQNSDPLGDSQASR